MDSKSDVLALLPQDVDELRYGILALRNSQPVARNDDDILGIDHGLDSFIDLPFGMRARDLHRFAGARAARAETTQDDIRQAPIHGLLRKGEASLGSVQAISYPIPEYVELPIE